jgi:hypothetical protein
VKEHLEATKKVTGTAQREGTEFARHSTNCATVMYRDSTTFTVLLCLYSIEVAQSLVGI